MPESAPLLISSPVRRSGTTLLQRLLCSASNTLIYGENCASEMQIHSNIYYSKQLFFKSSSEPRDQMFNSVVNGNVDDWIADLMPPVEGYLNAMRQGVNNLFSHYRTVAEQNGRPVWGAKMAEWHPSSLQQTQEFFTGSRLLYMNRALIDCAASAKRAGMLQSEQELEQFCQTYHQFSNYVQDQYPHPKLVIDFAQLVSDSARVINEIEEFSGAQGIKQSVLESRINTFRADKENDPSGQGYMAPIALTDSELAIVNRSS